MERIADLLVTRGYRAALRGLEDAVADFNAVRISGSRKPRVGVVGEILMNYHPGANGYIEEYLEKNGMEVCLPGMTDFFRKGNIADRQMFLRRLAPRPFLLGLKAEFLEGLFSHIHGTVVERMKKFRFAEEPYSIREIARNMQGLIDHTFQIGEGWLMPGEIVQMARHGVNSFVILNPFGCMPNHITGRGMIKTLKKFHPQIQILPLDYDPDTSFANIENRLQMLIITARELEEKRGTEASRSAAPAAADR